MKTLFDIKKQNIKEKRLDHIVRERDKIFKQNNNEETRSSFSPNDDENLKFRRSDTEEIGSFQHVPTNNPEMSHQDSETEFDDLSEKENSQHQELTYDEHRCIDPHVGLSASALYEFIPTTKLKGMEGWVSEPKAIGQIDHANFETKILPEWDLNFPKHLKVYTFEMGNLTSFPSPRMTSSGVLS